MPYNKIFVLISRLYVSDADELFSPPLYRTVHYWARAAVKHTSRKHRNNTYDRYSHACFSASSVFILPNWCHVIIIRTVQWRIQNLVIGEVLESENIQFSYVIILRIYCNSFTKVHFWGRLFRKLKVENKMG